MHKLDFKRLEESLPAIVARTEVHRLTGGAVATGTLANADSQGIGPKDRFMVGKRTCYHSDRLIEWLRERSRPIPAKGA